MKGGKKGSKGPKAKTIEKAKQKYIEDKTFGMKNKKKSKVVQKKIKGMINTMDGGRRKKEMEERELRKLEKLAEKEREKELQKIFNVVDDNKKNQDQSVENVEKEIEEQIKEESEMTLEEIIEKERAKIKEGTPVTEESFQKWKKFKEDMKRKAEEQKRKQEMARFKKSGTGLSGRELFEQRVIAFVDDEEAAEGDDLKRVEVDESLFLDDEGEGEEGEKEEYPEYDPNDSQWKEKPPKSLLVEYIQKNKIPNPEFKEEVTEDKLLCFHITFPHLEGEKLTTRLYKQKKVAQQNACLMALTFLNRLDEKNSK